MMFLELAEKRQSCRSYLSTPVEKEKLDICLKAARLAPSACNSQPWHFVVVDEPGLREQLAKATFGKLVSMNHFTMTAPVLVAVVREKSKMSARLGGLIKGKSFATMDVAIAAEHFCLAAADQGLGTCMLGWFNQRRAKKLLKVPTNKRLELIITCGYAEKLDVRKKSRKPINEIVSYNSYHK